MSDQAETGRGGCHCSDHPPEGVQEDRGPGKSIQPSREDIHRHKAASRQFTQVPVPYVP